MPLSPHIRDYRVRHVADEQVTPHEDRAHEHDLPLGATSADGLPPEMSLAPVGSNGPSSAGNATPVVVSLGVGVVSNLHRLLDLDALDPASQQRLCPPCLLGVAAADLPPQLHDVAGVKRG